GTMNGTVLDNSGAALPGVTVTIRNLDMGLERTVITDERGFFNAPFLPVGRYRVTAELSGLGVMTRQNVPVELNQTTVQDFMLSPALSETITVQADAPRINVTDGEIKQTMRSEEIMSIPTVVPDAKSAFLQLASVFAGFNENPTSGQDNPTASSGSSVNFNGAGTRGTTFQINGVNNDDSSENQHRQGVALATIKSIQVLTNNFSAEFGRGYGAVFLIQTKSGTNDFAGEVYGYAQDNNYNSKNILQQNLAKPDRYRRNYGFTLGFPVVHDRLFGFVNADHVENKGEDIATRGLFTPDLLALPRLTLGNDTPANRAWQDAIIARFPTGLTPNTPNVSPRAYSYPQERNWPDKEYAARLDWNANNSNTLTARYQRNSQKRENTELIVGEQTLQDNRQSTFGLTYTNVFSANTVHEARYGLGLRSTNVDILAGNDTPIVRFVGALPVGSFTILGNAGNFPIHRNQRDQQLIYNVSTARWSRHTFKGGVDIRKSQLNDLADNFSRGFWNFGATCAGVTYPSSIHAFMAGCISTFQKGFGPFALKNEIDESNAYIQDDWRVRDNLVLNIGVRGERAGAPSEENDLIDYFYEDTTYVDPRLGFAYTPNWERNRFFRALTGGNGRFSIRGGYGVFHGRVFQSVFSQGGANVRFNPPNALFRSFTNSTNISDPTGGFVFVPGQPPTGRISLTRIDPDLQMPETRQWNLTVERQVMAQARLRLSYIGLLGKGLLQYRFDNLPIRPDDPRSQYKVAADWRCAGTGLAGAPIGSTVAGVVCSTAVPLAANEISLRFPRINERRPDERYTTNLVVSNGADSSYHAGQMEFETGTWRGFFGRVTYTFSKAIDSGSEATFVGTGDVNILADYEHVKRGLSRFDTRHRITMTGSYRLPFFANRNDWMESVFGGWQLSTVLRLASGTPFTVVDGGAFDFDFDGVTVFRPVVVDKRYSGGWTINTPNDSRSQLPYSAFRRATFGDTVEDLTGRNTFFTDGQESLDLGLYKSFGLPAANTIMLRFDVFNVFNHTTWGFPSNDWGAATASTNFGRILSTNYTPRTFQAGLRFIY
ncbi:MAG TPA: carboxypeptidase regulatory-like domain-containing protein, partial [Thermoanaerobaculia bacterium]|nr:carboxypeptidase regulatory-like domain-containing protein [Thermoanaerobaculia bacterium]